MTIHGMHLERKLRKPQVRIVGKEGSEINWYFVNHDYKVYLVSRDTMKAKVDDDHRDIVWQDNGNRLIKGL